VQISLTAKGGGVIVTVTHAGVGSGGKWAKARQEFERGWKVGLENLQSVLETGQDLRYARRPILGVDIGVFDAETAAALGVPVTEGIRLDSVVEGKGAWAAGLQKDDVIVGLGGKKVTGWPALIGALQPRHAGDKVAVVFCRGSEKKRVTMELSRRPLPEVPSTPEALSEAVRKTQAELDAELARCFEGVSEAGASHRPAPGEWSATETVAHLIANEREVHGWIADLINGDERWSDENPTNVPARIAATVAAFPTVSALLEELKRNEAETIAMIAALAPEFVAHKASYWRLGHNLLQLPDHARTHFNQIRAALEAARKK